jgi:group I intron endonuclease
MYVYIITNKVNNKKYIGLSINKNESFRDTYYGSGKLIKQAILKYGKDNFIKEIMKEFDNEDDCRNYERLLIKNYNAVDDPMFYNLAPGGYGGASKGHIVTEETREKIRLSNSGENHYFVKMEPEMKKKFSDRMSILKTGVSQSTETLEKRSKSVKENWDSRSIEERKEIANKISKSSMGKEIKSKTREKLSKINARLTKEDVIKIHNLSKVENLTYSEIGKIYSINESSVWGIVNKVSYKWVWDELL